MKRLLLAIAVLLAAPVVALAANCPSFSYNLTNGQTADATQVMSNFNTVLNCANSNLAHNGANSDITSLSALSTALSISQGGTGQTTASTALTALGGLAIANNLSDLNSVSTSRTNLGLTTAATTAIGTSGATIPLLSASNTWGAKQIFFTPTTAAASINLPPGSAPTSPVNGDCWTTSVGVFCQVNGSTLTLATTSGAVTSFNSRTGAITLTSTDVTNALTFTPLNKAGDTLTGTLTLATGSTALAPMKFVAGTNLTAAAAGAVEWDGTNMFLTQTTGPTRKTVAYLDSTMSGNTTGSAAKWTTSRTETLSGDVSGSASVDGSANWTITTTIGAGTVTGSKIASATITDSNMVASTLTNASMAANTVTNAKLATMAANTIKGNNTGGSATPADLTVANVVTMLSGTTSGTLAAGNDSRFVGPTQNSQSTSYTLVLGDGGGQVYHPSADTTARTWTIPANASVAFQTGAKVELVNDCSAGAITLNITTDTLVWFPGGTTGSRTIAACGAATLTKVTSTRWVITGVGIS